jgi:hypothetical protein
MRSRPRLCAISRVTLFAAKRSSIGMTGGRISAALTACLFVLSSLIGLVHEATTRHVQCAEHGEQIHSDVPVARRAAPDHSVRDVPVATPHDHEHCLIASATRASRIAPSAPAVAVARVAATDVAPAIVQAECTRGACVYRTAPKTSPPA